VNDDMMVTYKKIFAYADTIIFNYLKTGKNLDRFRQISMDYDDVKQEVYIEILKAIDNYEKKYKDEEKVYLEPHVKKLCFYTMNKLLRDNQLFLHATTSEQEQMDTIQEIFKPNRVHGTDAVLPKPKSGTPRLYCCYCSSCNHEEIIEIFGKEIREAECSLCGEWRLVEEITETKSRLHPDLIASNIGQKKLDEDEVLKIINSCGLSDTDTEILELKIVYNYTLSQIKEELGLASEQAVQYKLKAGIKKLKKKYKTIPELFDK